MSCSREIAEKIVYLIDNCPEAEARWIRLLGGCQIYNRDDWKAMCEFLRIKSISPEPQKLIIEETNG